MESSRAKPPCDQVWLGLLPTQEPLAPLPAQQRMAAQNKDYITQPPLKLGGHVTLFWPMGCELSVL